MREVTGQVVLWWVAGWNWRPRAWGVGRVHLRGIMQGSGSERVKIARERERKGGRKERWRRER